MQGIRYDTFFLAKVDPASLFIEFKVAFQLPKWSKINAFKDTEELKYLILSVQTLVQILGTTKKEK